MLAKRLGDMLVKEKLITEVQWDAVMVSFNETGHRIVDILLENKFVDDYNRICSHAFVKAHEEDIPKEKVLEKFTKKINKDFLEWQEKWKPYEDLIIN